MTLAQRMLAIALVLFHVPPGAALWSTRSSNRNAARQAQAHVVPSAADPIDAFLTLTERDVILPQLHRLEAFKHRPDCFRDVSSTFTSLCTDEMGETERVDAAISFTLCEISTAKHHSVPMECIALRASGDMMSQDRSSLQSDCVEALSRSAQYWSSYSGYLREIPQLCFALRRWNDIDRAKALYQNATLEKIALIQMLYKRETSSILREDEAAAKWDRSIQAMNSLLENMGKSKQELFSSLGSEFAHLHEDFSVAQRAWSDMSEKLHSELYNVVHDVEGTINRALASASSTLVQGVQAEFAAAVEQHTTDVATSIMDGVETRLSSSLDDFLFGIQRQADVALAVIDSLHLRASEVVTGMNDVERVVGILLVHANALQPLLEQVGDNLSNQKAIINETQESAVSLARNLALLSATTLSEMQAINDTAYTMKLGMVRRSGTIWSKALPWLLQYVFRLNPGSAWHLTNIPVFRVLCATFQALWQLSYYLLSLIASCVMIFGRRRIPLRHAGHHRTLAVDEENRSWNARQTDRSWDPATKLQKTIVTDDQPIYRVYMPGAPQSTAIAHRHVPRISPRLTSIALPP